MRPLRVFLCHASQDKPAVRELYNVLKAENWIDPWLDKAKILPGQDWEMVIEKAVDNSDVVIVCLSNQSVTKEGFVQREIRYAYDIALEKPEDTIFLIPLRLDDCSVPRKLRTLHWVDYFGSEKENSYSDLLEALKLRHDQKLDLEAEEIARKQVGKMLKRPIEVPAVEKVDFESKPSPRVEKKKPVRDSESIKPGLPVFAMGLFVFVIISIFVWGIYTLNKQKESPELLLTKTPTANELPFTTESPIPGIGSTMISEKDGMVLVYVPAGEFTMGSDNGDSDDKPEHQVNLDAFWIDQTEVTNILYSKCVADGACQEPRIKNSYARPSYYGNFEFDNYPVIYVDWIMANAYCSWAGRRLPTEAEWEKAARGIKAFTYPWGDDSPNATLLNYNRNVGDTTEVGKYPYGASIYGAYDMAGNIREWVSSLHRSYPYDANDGREDMNSSDIRVLRGGSWGFYVSSVRTTIRDGLSPADTDVSVGFRCASSP